MRNRSGTRFSAITHAMLEDRLRREPVVDQAALVRVEAWEVEIVEMSERMGLRAAVGVPLGAVAGDEADILERDRFSARTRALRALQSANARVYETRRAALGGRSAETMAHRLGRAAQEIAEAREAVGRLLAQDRRAA